jgi:hypothetical protein
MKPVLKAPVTKRLKLEYDKLLSSVAFNFNLRPFNVAKNVCPKPTTARALLLSRTNEPLTPDPVSSGGGTAGTAGTAGRGLHSSTFRLKVSAF